MESPSNIKDAKKIQSILRKKLKICPLKILPRLIAGVDSAFSEEKVFTVASLYKYPYMTHIADASSIAQITFPYIPGFLSFREGHSMVESLNKLPMKPDLIIVDGQGIAHPMNMGIASHIGVIMNVPSIGCAKSRLVGEYSEPGKQKGDSTELQYNGKTVGAVLRTRDNVKPVYISPGYLIDIRGAVKIILKCTTRFRLPEPIRRADRLSRELKNSVLEP